MEIDIDVDASPSPEPAQPQSPTALTPAQRIADLNSIDLSVSTLLSSAAAATKVLSNQSPPSASSPTTLATAKDQFTQAAHLYFSTLSSIEVRLRRQIYALEEAGLIAAGDERDARRGRTLTTDDGSLTRRGGGVGGQLDPSWLNARVSESVELGKKREVLERGKELAEKMKRTRQKDEDVDMDG